MIVVLVSVTEQRFTVHKDIICTKPKFFTAACRKSWPEGRVKVVRLPEVEPTTFQLYLDWVYSDNIATESNGLPESHKPLVKLYLLGNYLGDMQCRNETMKVPCAHHQDLGSLVPSEKSAHLVWENTTPGSLLRKWLVDIYVWRASSDFLVQAIVLFPPELTQQFALVLREALKQRSTASAVLQRSMSEYLEVEDTG